MKQGFRHSLCNNVFLPKMKHSPNSATRCSISRYTHVLLHNRTSVKETASAWSAAVHKLVLALATDGTANGSEHDPCWGIPPPKIFILKRQLLEFSNQKVQHRSYFEVHALQLNFGFPAYSLPKKTLFFLSKIKHIMCLVFLLCYKTTAGL